MPSNQILIMYSTEPPTSGHLQRLRDISGNRKVVVVSSEDEAIQVAPQTEIILGHRYLWQTLPYAPHLKWIQSSASGTDHLMVPGLQVSRPCLTRTPIFSDIIAWHAFSLGLALIRGLGGSSNAPGHQTEIPDTPPLSIPKTAMIFGMGHIGIDLGKLLKGLGLRVIGINRSGGKPDETCDILISSNRDWKSYLSQVNMLFLCAPCNDETFQVINENVLSRLPDSAILVNVGRGSLIDHSALIRQLKTGRLRAGLDVLDNVSEHQKSCMESLSNVIITPKTATFCTNRQAIFESFVEDQVKRYSLQQPPLYEVDY